MKVAQFEDLKAKFTKKNVWISVNGMPKHPLLKDLNQVTKDVELVIGPQHGHPRQALFNKVLSLLNGKVLIDDEAFPMQSGVVY